MNPIEKQRQDFAQVRDRVVEVAEQAVELLAAAVTGSKDLEYVPLPGEAADLLRQDLEQVHSLVVDLRNLIAEVDATHRHVAFLDRADCVLEYALLTLYLGTGSKESDAHVGRIGTAIRQLSELAGFGNSIFLAARELPEGVVQLKRPFRS